MTACFWEVVSSPDIKDFFIESGNEFLMSSQKKSYNFFVIPSFPGDLSFLKLVLAIFYQFFIFSLNDSPLKTMKNAFYLI